MRSEPGNLPNILGINTMAKSPVDTSGLDTLKAGETDQTQTQGAAEGHVAVTARGVALLALIKEAEGGFLMLTQDEGADIVQLQQAFIDGTVQPVDGAVAVRLTPAGEAVLAAAPPAVTRATRAPVTVSAGVRTDIPAPGKKRGGKKGSKYPFNMLQVGESFHIAATLENTDPLSSVASSITMARAKYAEPQVNPDGSPVMETVTVKDYQKNADGKIVKGADGHRVVLGEKEVTRQATKVTRDFTSAAVDATDPDGVGARVWRIA